jgi:flagellar hook-associated protein 2
MSSLALSGLASGVDTSSIVQQLMAVDQQVVTQMTNKQSTITGHQAALKNIGTKLAALQTAASALTDSTAWKSVQTVSSSDSSKVSAAIVDGTGIGGHTISVDKLASSAQHGFTFASSATAGSLKITGPDGTTTSIAVAANATDKDIAAGINASTTAPVYAAVIKADDGTDRIVLSSRTTGQHSDFTVDTSAMGDPAQMSEDATYSRTGTQLNAAYHIDGETAARSSESNSVDNAIPGLRLTLTGTTTSPVSVTVNQSTVDKTALTSKVQAFVDAYNGVVDLTRADIAEKPIQGATTLDDLQTGTLFGDLGLDSMLSSLKDTMTKTLTNVGGLTSLADIGITIPKADGMAPTDDAMAGKLTFDSTVLSTALDKNPTQVQQLFNGVGARKGVGLLVSDFVNAQNGLNGVLTGRENSDTTSIKDLTDQITATNERLTQQQQRLEAQFATMETALSNAQAQQAWLTGQINSLG